ncbi:MAG: thioredoxin family protein [Nanoarchaeota archaeon]|nr:thioredoxin family protein [Nanoarchaeota archaeon]
MKKISIEIVTAQGCAKCEKANEKIRGLMKGVKGVTIKEINLIENPEIAVKYGIMSTPAIIINHKLEFTGIPDEDDLKKIIENKNEN